MSELKFWPILNIKFLNSTPFLYCHTTWYMRELEQNSLARSLLDANRDSAHHKSHKKEKGY